MSIASTSAGTKTIDDIITKFRCAPVRNSVRLSCWRGWIEISSSSPTSQDEPFKNSYRSGWEQFLRHVADGDPLISSMLEGAKDVQLTELCYQSDRERRWIDVPELHLAN